jgi:hypothetical protein
MMKIAAQITEDQRYRSDCLKLPRILAFRVIRVVFNLRLTAITTVLEDSPVPESPTNRAQLYRSLKQLRRRLVTFVRLV